jgi:hypothetical protein
MYEDTTTGELLEDWTLGKPNRPGVEPPPNVRCPKDGDKVFLNGEVRVIKSVKLYEPCPGCGFHRTCICVKPDPHKGYRCTDCQTTWDGNYEKCPFCSGPLEAHGFNPRITPEEYGPKRRLAELRGKYGATATVGIHWPKKKGGPWVQFDDFQEAADVINELLDMLEAKEQADEITREKPVEVTPADIKKMVSDSIPCLECDAYGCHHSAYEKLRMACPLPRTDDK